MNDPNYRPVRSPLVSMGPSLDEERRRYRLARQIAVVSIIALILLITVIWFVMLLGREVVQNTAATKNASKNGQSLAASAPALPTGPPVPQRLADVVLSKDEPSMRLQLPIKREAVTAIGFGRRDDPAVLELVPSGARANLSWGKRFVERFLSTAPVGDLSWYRLADGAINMVTVGALPKTDAYAPIDGRVLAIKPYVLDGEKRGSIVQLQPLGDGQTVIAIRNLDAEPNLTVGQAVSEGITRIGYVRDMEGAIEAPLSVYTHDSGSGVEMYVTRSRRTSALLSAMS